MKTGNTEIIVKQGDITEEDTRAIVNAANNHFFMGGGVAGAIKRRGGKSIEEAAVKLGPVEIGESVMTSAGSLKADFVIHACTMGKDFKTDEEKIRRSAASTLKIAQDNNIESLSFCALGCGVGGFSYKDSAKIICQEIFRYLKQTQPLSLKKIVFVLYDSKSYEIFSKVVDSYLGRLTDGLKHGPFLTVDGIIDYKGGIVLVERLNPPSGWAIPGGFVEYGEQAEEGVVREVKEETNLDFIDVKQFKVYSKPGRDPRFHTVSVVFTGSGEGEIKAASDAKSAKVFKMSELPSNIAFDHRQILKEYRQQTTDHRPQT